MLPVDQRHAARFVALLAGLAMAAAGLLHLALAPIHAEHSIQHGMALYTVGIIDMAWTAGWLRRRTDRLLWWGWFLAVLTITLYAITRFLPLPFEGKPEAMEPLALTSQILEASALLSLAAVSFLQADGATRTLRSVTASGGLALVAAWIVYGAASLAAPAWRGGP
jgi:hypothetical protein